jgi:predicted lipoprotein with Yx(FWY)xxD motif
VRHRGQLAGTILVSAGLLIAGVAAPALATSHSKPAVSHAKKGTKIATVKTKKYGKVLSNTKGRVIYLSKNDTSTVSRCTGECATAWPRVMSTKKPIAGAGLKAAHLSRNAKHQVTYYGHPLYYFFEDKKSGKVSGEAENSFFLVNVHGKAVKPPKKKKPTGPTGPTGPAAVTTGMVNAHTVLISGDSTLYALFNPDEMTTFSCTGSCLTNWQPLLTKGTPTETGGADGTLSTVTRTGIGTQVTYDGLPLYSFTGDTKAGDDNGEMQFGPLYVPPTYTLQYWYNVTAAGAAQH